jgi:hypothetical protein
MEFLPNGSDILVVWFTTCTLLAINAAIGDSMKSTDCELHGFAPFEPAAVLFPRLA